MAQTQRPYGELPAAGFVRLSNLIPSVIPVSHSTLWRRVRDGEFPAPVKLSPRVTAWRVEDVRAWLDAQTAVRDPGGPANLRAARERRGAP